MRPQTCRRHPNAAPFLATCSGCAQELYDIAERNRALNAATKAIAAIGAPADAQILDATWAGGALIVATRQPSSIAFEFAVDTFRLPTPDEVDPDQTEPRTPGEWILIDQYGGHNADDVPGMVSDAVSCAQAVLPPCSLAAA